MGSSWWQCTACLRAQEEDICELQLNHCNLYDVPGDVFIYERTLEQLYLDANRIKDLPRPLFQCHELRVLSLSDNEVTSLPPAIASLINLEHLDLSKNSIKELPDSIKECKNLRSIDLSVNPFERFPDAITHIIGLRELYINDAYIEYLPANFGRLSALRTLELRENNMMTLPKSMSRLTNLQRLDIGNNDFTELPEVVGDLTNLTELWIDGNDIRRIPVNIEQLYRLNHFDCTMNAVHDIPTEIQGWRDISIMNFSSNEIYQLPDSICYLRTIVTLKIDDNQLNSLPVEIGQMSSLEELIVTKNFLEFLPSSIGLLRKLHCLNADNNYLRCLPPEIGSCNALSLLSLRSNNLTDVPPELGHLSSLRVLNLVNNCIQFLPVSMLNLTNLKALWLSDNQSQPLVPLQQEFNHEEDMMILSCFMLPQKQRKELEKMEQAVGPISGSIVGTGRKICFAAEVEIELPRQLHRAPTPYPKELRNLARHARNLHHQSMHDQRTHSEHEEGMVKEAVVAKSTPTLNTINHHQQQSPSDNKQNPDALNLVEPIEEINRTILAQKTLPEIREAKCVKNPGNNDLQLKPPTIADYVSSTWKPEEYSKTNTAKIVESEKFTEPYKNNNICDQSTIIDLSGKKLDTPLSPPPYHIAAAFSKKAALFQQLNRSCVDDITPSYTHTDNHTLNINNDNNNKIQMQSSKNNQNNQNDIINNNHDTVDSGLNNNIKLNTSIDNTANINNNNNNNNNNNGNNNYYFKEDKPSRIPILKCKNNEGSICESENSYYGDKNGVCLNFDESDKCHEILSEIDIPTSPVTGRKYRSPLSSAHNQLRHSDRSKKSNGSIKNDGLNMDLNNSIELHNDKNSGRSTPLSNNNDSLDINGLKVNGYNSPGDKKPKLKWMFGPHKNVSVLPVQVRKNPGLGFTISGGIAGNETGIIVTKVNPAGPAQGTLKPGDKILEVDGIDLTKSDHDSAVGILRSTGSIVSMMISRPQ
ncbi:hypothetical protein HCN44_009281 [Aphidius gifuensis]|uniref:PDZ domain-containing protein n=1 Tax=Aphidius gifuensis TaxID=684658 RepID=A0A834Y676_APHGI|nr:protein lap1 [Aphidius gifuensis]KAF7997883.1 hypothetical protein HCN44_009281 [Aphidius gifuensis]